MSGPAAASRKKDALDYSRFDAIVVSDDDDDAPHGSGDDEEEFEEVSGSDEGGEGSQPETDADESPEELDDLACVAHCTDAGAGSVGTAVPQAPPVYCTCGRCGAAVGLGALCSPGGKGAAGPADAAATGQGAEDGAGHDGEVDGSAEGTKPGAAGQPGGPPHCALHAGAPLPPLPPLGEERYDGELDGTGQRHGYGRYVWRNGAVYEGTVRGGRGETARHVGGPAARVSLFLGLRDGARPGAVPGCRPDSCDAHG